jgi:outer membrane cobalamin receptor
MYRVLTPGIEAYYIREEIVTRNFVQYVPGEFEQADDAGMAAIAAYEAGQMEGLQKNAEDIQSLYRSILKTGWISFVTEREAAAKTERQAALDAKANVALRSDFDTAAALYSRADASFRAENYDDAALFYGQAEFQFANAAKDALEKRRVAETAIKAAEEKMIESDENARRAELVIEGGAL